ncbi:MAG: helix-turn-helix transcriptional regulator [Clostridiales bacterium]|jgi:DNA-binding Xre family transcriptional regulator|nr:helix-turn-helix transcriptional regulator [Clostridiales bacterium]
MTVSYKKLWVLCAEQEMSKGDLRKLSGLSASTFTKLRRNKEVTISVLLKIADVMNCNAGDMMDFLPDECVEEELT